jgi:hypothetical protein
VLLQSALLDLALSLAMFIIQAVPVSDGSNLFWVILGPFASIDNAILQYAGCYFQTFLRDFAGYGIAIQYFYRWLLICR